MQLNNTQVFVGEIGTFDQTKYLICELNEFQIKDKINIYNTLDLLNQIHKTNQLTYSFVVLFICYDQQSKDSQTSYHNSYLAYGSQTNQHIELSELWKNMRFFIDRMPVNQTVFFIDLCTKQFQLKVVQDMPPQVKEQLIKWLQQNNGLINIHYQLSEK